MDPRELYGGSSLHHQTSAMLAEEVARISHAALSSTMVSALPAEVTEASPDGHSVTLRSTVKKVVLDPVTGLKTYEDYPIAPDVPIHFPGGAKMVLTHGLEIGDEVASLNFSRNIDGWRQQGGSQQPFDEVIQHLGDSVAIPGIRSDPRRLMQVDTQAAHLRSEDKTAVHEVHPRQGARTFHADPSTPAASPSFDPLSMASAFYHHLVQSAQGVLGQAVSSGGTHEHGVTHSGGAFMRAMNGLHQVLANPGGALLSAFSGAHTVTANASGVQIASSAGIALQCPPGGLGLPAGGVSGGSLAAGAASSNVGQLDGDLSGSLPSPTVTGLHVDFSQYPAATSDSAAAGAGVPVGGLYRDTGVAAGKSYLAVRMI